MIPVSVIIPVKNGAATLERCLNSVNVQKDIQPEIIILLSYSEDKSENICRQYGCRIIHIPAAEFNHGLTRNIGEREASAELIYYTVQDAWIRDEDMLCRMAAHFSDSKVMGVTGHQGIAHENNSNPFYWYTPYTAHTADVREIADVNAFKNLPQQEQRTLVAWDNVVAMYRKSALAAQPFIETGFSEDWAWSYNALLKGWKLIRDSSLIVYHYHHRTYGYVFRVTYIENYYFLHLFNYKPALPGLVMPSLKAAYHLMKRKGLTFREKIYWTFHNLSANTSRFLSTADFLRRLKFGGNKSLDRGYEKYCKAIPQGKIKA